MNKRKLYSLSFLGGILFFLSWPPYGFPFLLFVAFVPILQIEHAFSSGQTKARSTLLFGLSYLTFFIWNITTTFWVCNASIGGGAMAILANSFIMAGVVWLFHIVKQKMAAFNWSPSAANRLFPIFWLGYEFFHHRWDLTWPWLTLGNAFASFPSCIQWYEYTGTCGGSLWAIVINLMVFSLLKNGSWQLKAGKWQTAGICLTISVPILLSLVRYYTYDAVTYLNPSSQINIVIVQPNIDPYSEKFSGMNYEDQLNKMLELAKQKTDSMTDYLIFPETALTESIWENDLKQTASIHILKEFLKPFPKLKIIVGASTWRLYKEGEKLSVTARKFKQQEGYFDAFNTALQVDNSDSIQLYHKSKLVPGVERMPYPAVFGLLENLAIDLGGTAGSLGTQEERVVFKAPSIPRRGDSGNPLSCVPPFGRIRGALCPPIRGVGGLGIAPVICYESIYGEYVGEYIKNGATLIFIITNDGWWRDTPGYKQHLIYGALRAIETRRCIACSANTGISCFINERGDISQATEWWNPAVIQTYLNSHSGKTFYVKYGDLIGRVCFYVSGIVLLFAAGTYLFKKKYFPVSANILSEQTQTTSRPGGRNAP